jgi:predicted RNase H-like nuclease (RuvC/YqgF family)
MAMLTSICTKFGISPTWLLLGDGPKYQAEGEDAQGQRQAAPVACPRCEKMEGKLEKERDLNRELVAENRQLWKENGDLRVELERAKARAAPEDTTPEDAQNCA